MISIWSILIFLLMIQNSLSTEEINESYIRMVLKNLNTTADPCEDFFQYSCGNWSMNYVSEEYLDMPGYMEYLVNKQFLEIINANKHKGGIYQKVSQYYQSCEELTDPALNYYLKIVQSELKFQWPIFRENWNASWKNESYFDWLAITAHLRSYGLNGVFLTQNTNVRLTNGSHYLLEVHQHQPRLTLQLDGIKEIFISFGMSDQQSTNISMEVIALEEHMRNLTNVEFTIETEEDDLRYKNSFQEITVEELVKIAPQIDWVKYLSIILSRKINAKSETVQTFAFNAKYYEQLTKVLQETSNETIAHYIMLKFMYHLNDNLPAMKNKTMFCVKLLRGHMALAMNFLYEEYYYKPRRNATDSVLFDLFQRLRKTFESLVAENFLGLDSKEQTYILDELKTMQLKIGNIPKNVNQSFVENYYRNITTDPSDFYRNHLQFIKLNTRLQQEKLRNLPMVTEMQFYEHDPETASSSSPVKIFDNVILVPYGYLQLPLFDPALNPFLQYSLFGFIIAHEIIHAYDLFHIVYDQYGNYNDMGVAVAHHFWKNVDCFARHPTDNLSENIADVAGLRLVHRAYFDDVNSLRNDNGFSSAMGNITKEQFFFINSVQFLCANMEKISSLETNSLNLEHDMHDIRVRQNWANLEQFSLAFQCSNDTTMNPTIKCRLW